MMHDQNPQTRFDKRTSYFGRRVYSPLLLFLEGRENGQDRLTLLQQFVREQLQVLLEEKLGGILERDFTLIRECCIKSGINPVLRKEASLLSAEIEVEEVLRKELFPEDKSAALHGALGDRATKIHRQIRGELIKFLPKKQDVSVLDFGCGDGLVAKRLRDNAATDGISYRTTALADVRDYRHKSVKDAEGDFPWIRLPSDYEYLIDSEGNRRTEEFDCILLLTVLHHSYDPKRSFRACWEALAPGGIIVAIESCVGIDEKFVKAHKTTDGRSLNQEASVQKFLKLKHDTDQVLYATFLDWFYNRVQHKDVVVPCEYGSPHEWNRFFEEFSGLSCVATYAEGFDQPTVPEFHTLHIVKKQSHA